MFKTSLAVEAGWSKYQDGWFDLKTGEKDHSHVSSFQVDGTYINKTMSYLPSFLFKIFR